MNNQEYNVAQNSEDVQNVCRISNESHIEYILETHKDKIIVLIFTPNDPKLKIYVKRKLSKEFCDCFFVFCLLDKPEEKIYNFTFDRDIYLKDMKNKKPPIIYYYYNKKELATMSDCPKEDIEDVLIYFHDLQNKSNEANDQQTQDDQYEQEKIKMAYEYQVENMTEKKKMHELEELEKIQAMKKLEENKNNMSKQNFNYYSQISNIQNKTIPNNSTTQNESVVNNENNKT